MLRCGRLASDQQRTKNYPACTYQDLLSRDECFAGRVRYEFTGREWPIRTDCSRKDIVGELADVELAASTGLRHGGLAETASSREIGQYRCESGAVAATEKRGGRRYKCGQQIGHIALGEYLRTGDRTVLQIGQAAGRKHRSSGSRYGDKQRSLHSSDHTVSLHCGFSFMVCCWVRTKVEHGHRRRRRHDHPCRRRDW